MEPRFRTGLRDGLPVVELEEQPPHYVDSLFCLPLSGVIVIVFVLTFWSIGLWRDGSLPANKIVSGPPSAAFELPLAVIDLHSSGQSADRIKRQLDNWMYNSPYINNGTFEIRMLISNQVHGNFALKSATVDCADVHEGPEGLGCRVEKSYSKFLEDFPKCLWYYQGKDDMWMNLTNFYHYLLRLNTIFRPNKHIVLKAHANMERLVRHYIHGGSGWLVSRAYAEYHVSHDVSLPKLFPKSRYHQEDTSQSIIARHLFPRPELWDEPTIVGFQCDQCSDPRITQQRWEALDNCPTDRPAVRLSDLMVLHTCSYLGGINDLLLIIYRAPTWVMLYCNVLAQRSLVCKANNETKIFDPNGPRENVLLESKDVPNPLINFETLHDDNTD
jgi:hypothetical protein